MPDHGQDSDQADYRDQAKEKFHDGLNPMEAGEEARTTTHTGRSRVIDNRIPPRLRYSHRSDEKEVASSSWRLPAGVLRQA